MKINDFGYLKSFEFLLLGSMDCIPPPGAFDFCADPPPDTGLIPPVPRFLRRSSIPGPLISAQILVQLLHFRHILITLGRIWVPSPWLFDTFGTSLSPLDEFGFVLHGFLMHYAPPRVPWCHPGAYPELIFGTNASST